MLIKIIVIKASPIICLNSNILLWRLINKCLIHMLIKDISISRAIPNPVKPDIVNATGLNPVIKDKNFVIIATKGPLLLQIND